MAGVAFFSLFLEWPGLDMETKVLDNVFNVLWFFSDVSDDSDVAFFPSSLNDPV